MLRDDLFPFQFLKKSRFTGSYQGMSYRLEKAERTERVETTETEGNSGDVSTASDAAEKKVTVLAASVFPGPYAYEYTNPEQITSVDFPFTQEGYEEAKNWLEQQADSRSWQNNS